jgi:hypothetical protein
MTAKLAFRTRQGPTSGTTKRVRRPSKEQLQRIEVLKRQRERIQAVIESAKRSGLLEEKTGRIAGRVSAELIEQAKARTGLTSDTELVEFALASLALEDNFAETFRKTQATVDPSLKLGFSSGTMGGTPFERLRFEICCASHRARNCPVIAFSRPSSSSQPCGQSCFKRTTFFWPSRSIRQPEKSYSTVQ